MPFLIRKDFRLENIQCGRRDVVQAASGAGGGTAGRPHLEDAGKGTEKRFIIEGKRL